MKSRHENVAYHSFIPVMSFTRQVNDSINSTIEDEISIKLFNGKLKALLDLIRIIEKHGIKFELSPDTPGVIVKQEIDEEVIEIIQDSLSEIFMEHIIVLSRK